MLSDKKKNATSETYTLDELETEINSLSGPEGKTVTFRNLDSSGGQHIEVVQPSQSWSQDGSTDLSITAKFPTINFWVQGHARYVPGELDVQSPLDLSTVTEDTIITASTGYTQPTGEDKELVDMSYWCKNNRDMIQNGYFTDATKEYFKTVKPTSLKYFFGGNNIMINNLEVLNILDTSACTDFSRVFYLSFTTRGIVNLSGLNTSNCTNFNYCLYYLGFNNAKNGIIDITSWDTSKGTSFISFLMCPNLECLTFKGIIDLSSASTYTNLIAIGDTTIHSLFEPIKLKNVPLDFNYKKAGFTSEDQFQILSHR